MFRFSQSPTAVLTVGVVVFVVGLGLALVSLPEWRLEPLPDHEFFIEKADETVARLGLRKLDEFHLQLTERGLSSGSALSEREQFDQYRQRTSAADWLEKRGRTYYVLADTQVENRSGKQLSVDLKFSLRGELVSFSITPDELGSGLLRGVVLPGVSSDQIVSTLLRDGEVLGEKRLVGLFGSDLIVYPVNGPDGTLEESIQLVSPDNFPMIVVSRSPATADQIADRSSDFSLSSMLRVGWKLGTRVAFALSIVVLLAVLLTRRSVGMRNGLVLAAIQFLFVIPPVIRGQQQLVQTIAMDLLFLASVFVVFIGWSAAESWYRILSNETTTGIDHLRERILGHEEGRSMVAGWGIGALIAGGLLICASIAHYLSWLTATTLSVDLSAVYQVKNPWFSAVMVTIAILLARSAGLRWFSSGRLTLVSLVVGTLLLVPVVALAPFPMAILVALALSALLLWTLRHYRLLGLLTAAIVFLALPLAIFSLVHPVWQPTELFITMLLSVVPLIAGVVGLGRSDVDSRERVATPMFMRRLEHERRLRYEMDLLARMQLGLLPESPPDLEGWEIAVRSVLPTEVGGDFYEFIEDEKGCVWVAMGDVSGHGYQCSIVHAMTKAALLSLVSAKLRPGEIMDKLDQVLRHSGTARTFVALALMRIDPRTGVIDYSNAASPFPLVVSKEGIEEIELSTLPLGHGPVQAYHDHQFTLDPGSAIIFWSDGLYEARDTREDEYGYERPGLIATDNLGQDAAAIMESIFTDWTRFRGEAELEDDTTVLVIKRNMNDER